MEYNHVRHVGAETEDIGIIYTGGRDWISSRGSRISYNYFHDILGYGRSGSRWISPYFARGIYLDDNAGGVDVIGNIVARAVDGVLMLHNSRDSRFENNIFIDGTLHQVNALGWTATHPFWTNTLPQMLQGYASVLGQPAWRNMPFMELHPEKAVLPSGLVMANNVLLRNIFYYHNPKAKLYQPLQLPAGAQPVGLQSGLSFRPSGEDSMGGCQRDQDARERAGEARRAHRSLAGVVAGAGARPALAGGRPAVRRSGQGRLSAPPELAGAPARVQADSAGEDWPLCRSAAGQLADSRGGRCPREAAGEQELRGQ